MRGSPKNRSWAQFLLLLRELAAHDGTPRRCLSCLASGLPRTRLADACALEAFADPKEFLDFVTELVNDRGDDPPWKVSGQTVGDLAPLLAFGQPGTRAQTCYTVRWLCFGEQPGWNQQWSIQEDRHTKEIDALRVTSPESDYAALHNTRLEYFDDSTILERVCERGDPRRIFEVLPDATEDAAPALAASLLARLNLPLVEAEQFISINDALNYIEPPDWYIPVRELLGAVLLQDGQAAEAEAVFRAALVKHPRNGRALFGLRESLQAQKKTYAAKLVDQEFAAAWKHADQVLDLMDY